MSFLPKTRRNQMIEESVNKLIKILSIINGVYGEELHKKCQLSLAHAAMGVLASESLFLHRMAEGLVKTRGGDKKHTTKQIERLLSNKGISVRDLSEFWIRFVIGDKKILL